MCTMWCFQRMTRGKKGEAPPLHTNARSKHPFLPERTPVSDANVPWSVPWASYEPVPYTAKVVIENNRATKQGGWADPEISGLGPDDWKKRVSHEGAFQFDAQKRPLNPRGRTGIADRGLLGKWGCNHAADPVVTRWHPTDKGRLQAYAHAMPLPCPCHAPHATPMAGISSLLRAATWRCPTPLLPYPLPYPTALRRCTDGCDQAQRRRAVGYTRVRRAAPPTPPPPLPPRAPCLPPQPPRPGAPVRPTPAPSTLGTA